MRYYVKVSAGAKASEPAGYLSLLPQPGDGLSVRAAGLGEELDGESAM